MQSLISISGDKTTEFSQWFGIMLTKKKNNQKKLGKNNGRCNFHILSDMTSIGL